MLKMNILVTGGAGYLGAELVNKLEKNPLVNKIKVYDNLTRKNVGFFTGYTFNHAKIEYIDGDLLDSRKLKKAIKDCDIVYHLAALTDKNSLLDSHSFEQINHWATSELVNSVEESNVKKLIYLSSTAVYGTSEEILNEQSEPHPDTFYASSKLRGEEQVKRLFGSKKCYILRVANVYGYSPCLRFDGVINKFMFDANFKNRISIIGNGRQYRNYIHIDSVSEILQSFLKVTPESSVFNLVDKNLQVLDIVEVLQEMYHGLEFIFINQHLKIKDLQLSNESKLSAYIKIQSSSLIDDLNEFKKHFSF